MGWKLEWIITSAACGESCILMFPHVYGYLLSAILFIPADLYSWENGSDSRQPTCISWAQCKPKVFFVLIVRFGCEYPEYFFCLPFVNPLIKGINNNMGYVIIERNCNSWQRRTSVINNILIIVWFKFILTIKNNSAIIIVEFTLIC